MSSTRSKGAGLAATLAGLLLTACATPQYPVRIESAPTPPPPAPAAAPAPAPAAPPPAPSTPVQGAPLPPVGQGGASAAPTPASPWARPASVGDIPSRVTVGENETLFDVAERVRTPVRALIEANDLRPPYDNIPPGTTLRVPPPLFYTVGQTDTLFGVGRRFNIDPRSLANLNGIQFETPLRAGQRLALPAGVRDQGANAQAAGPTPQGMAMAAASARPSTPARPTASRPARSASPPVASTAASGRTSSGLPPIGQVPAAPPLAQAPSTAPSVAPAPPVSPADLDVAAVGRGKFVWPLRGEVLSGFGPKGPGQRNDGLNIAAGAGEPVRAAAAGEVVFAGELPSFGNLVLIKHADGWVTAYAHLSRIDVKMRQSVAQGAPVGLTGQTGMVDRPQLHFEIRYAESPRDKARPVDPALLLPKAG